MANREGKIVESWTQWDKLWEGSRGPHHIKINPYDPEKHVWIIDDDLQQIMEFTNDGKQLVKTIGERLVKGTDGSHFGRPTDIAWLPDGTFFITDGYINTRVLKFDKDGKFLMTWGTEGSGPGQFKPAVHAVAIDDERRLYIADRGNSRIQIFDENGKFLDQWPNIRDPWDIHIASDQRSVWVADGAANKFLKFDKSGHLLYSWGTFGQFPGGLWGVHQFSVDSEGNLYTAEAFGGRAEKFRPKPGADPAKVIPPARPLPVSRSVRAKGHRDEPARRTRVANRPRRGVHRVARRDGHDAGVPVSQRHRAASRLSRLPGHDRSAFARGAQAGRRRPSPRRQSPCHRRHQ